MKKALIVGGTSPQGMYLMRSLANSEFVVLNVGLLGPEEGSDVLRLKSFAPTKEVTQRMRVRPGDARKYPSVESWFLEAVPDVVHFMVGSQTVASHIKARLTSLTNVMTAIESFYSTAGLVVHQRPPAPEQSITSVGAMNVLERILLRDVESKFATNIVEYGSVLTPGGTWDPMNLFIKNALSAGSEEAIEANTKYGIDGVSIGGWVDKLTTMSEDMTKIPAETTIPNDINIDAKMMCSALNAVNPAFTISKKTRDLEPPKEVLDMVRACHDAHMELNRR